MPQRNPHSETVSAWREGWAGTLPPTALVDVYERALEALWGRAHLSLGEVTLMAIADRVLHHGVEKFPHLSALKVEMSGLNCAELLQVAPAIEVALLEESLVFLVVELLRVFGTLTGEILTPGLHAELRKIRVGLAVAERGSKV